MMVYLSLSNALLAQQNQEAANQLYLPNGQWHSPYLPNGEYSPYLDFSLEYLQNIGFLEQDQNRYFSSYANFYNFRFDLDMTSLSTSFLELVSRYVDIIEPEEILGSSRNFRYEGGMARVFFQPPPVEMDPANAFYFFGSATVNDLADAFHLNNMERLELLKYLLDAGFVPRPPYIDFANYFQVEEDNDPTLFTSSNSDPNAIYPTTNAIVALQDILYQRSWSSQLDFSPASFIRLALFNILANPEYRANYRNSSLRFIEYDFLIGLFNSFDQLDPGRYHPKGFTSDDLRRFGQLVRDMGYIPGWPDRGFDQRHPLIKDVTDDTFETEVIEASKTRPILIYLHASWCSSFSECQMAKRAIHDLAAELERRGRDITIARVYETGNPKIVENFSNENIAPAFMTYYDGQPLYELDGLPVFKVHRREDINNIALYMSEDVLQRYAAKEYLKRELIDPLIDLYHWKNHRAEK